MWLICWSAVGGGEGRRAKMSGDSSSSDKNQKKEKQTTFLLARSVKFVSCTYLHVQPPKIRGRLVIVIANVNSSLLFCELFPIYTLALSADAKSAKIEDCILHKQMVTNFICLNLF